jgi:hypothetical protein
MLFLSTKAGPSVQAKKFKLEGLPTRDLPGFKVIFAIYPLCIPKILVSDLTIAADAIFSLVVERNARNMTAPLSSFSGTPMGSKTPLITMYIRLLTWAIQFMEILSARLTEGTLVGM